MEISSYGEIYNVKMEKNEYNNNGNLAIRLIDTETGEPFAIMTKNLDVKLPKNRAYVDTNNCPWAEDFIRKYKLGFSLRQYRRSGYCSYPLYEFF